MDIKMDLFNISKNLQYGFFVEVETDFKHVKVNYLNVLIGILKYTYFMYRLKQANKSYSNI